MEDITFMDTVAMASIGDVSAMFDLGLMYSTGNGVKQNSMHAAKWYAKAASRGHPDSLYNLGIMYLEGDGVRRDSAKAFRLIDKADAARAKNIRKWVDALADTE